MTIACVSFAPVTDSGSTPRGWVSVDNAGLALHCWWSPAIQGPRDIPSISAPKRVYIVLPEVFGLNAWVRGVADRLAAQGIPALAVPLFSRTAPRLDLDYSEVSLAEGRRHKEVTTTAQILSDLAAAIAWLRSECPAAAVDVVGFCFGGHAALLAATLPQVRSSFDFYGAGVSTTRPGGGPPSLELLSEVAGRLTCLCGTADSLIPLDHRAAIQAALKGADETGERLRYVELEGADHGFMCEERDSFDLDASQRGWAWLLEP